MRSGQSSMPSKKPPSVGMWVLDGMCPTWRKTAHNKQAACEERPKGNKGKQMDNSADVHGQERGVAGSGWDEASTCKPTLILLKMTIASSAAEAKPQMKIF